MDQREFVLQKIDALLNEHSSHYSENSVAILDDLFDAIEKCKSSFSSIHAAPHLTGLVKMRGMIQNGAEAEYVHFAYRRADSPSLTTPLLRDDFDETLTIQAEEESGRLLARHCFRVVEVPGASDWYVDEFEVNDISSAKKSRKTDGAQPIQLLSKFYGDAAENLKPNQVVDIYGLLTNEKSDDRNAAVLQVIKYSLVTPNDLAKGFNLSKNDMHCTLVVLQKNLEHILGDSSSASFLLANILSSTYSRPGGMPICSIPVNVQGVSDSAPIISFLKNVLPTVKTLELSPDFLSTAAFASFKDYDTDRLVQGELQLASGTLVVIDETKLPEGSFPVSKHAETNLKTLEQLILEQRINYDYGFYKLPFDVDYPILILSKGKTSRILKTPFTVPFVPNVTGADVPPLNESTALTIARKYIQCVRSNLRNISITAETTKMINESFIEIAKKLDKNIDKADFLNETLILSRIFAASEGDSFVTDKHWNMAISLENSRNEAMRMFSSMQNS